MPTFTQKVKEFARERGADLVGIAGKDCFGRLPGIKPDELVPNAASVIVLARSRRRRTEYTSRYGGRSWYSAEQYPAMLVSGISLTNAVAAYLESEGYHAFPMSGHCRFSPQEEPQRIMFQTLTVDEYGIIHGKEDFLKLWEERMEAVPLKSLAVEAGLGEIGLSSLLLTPEFGPRVGLSVVITDAELEPDTKFEKKLCPREKCNRCAEACPVNAIKPDGLDVVQCMIEHYGIGDLNILDVIERGDEREKKLFLALTHLAVFPTGTTCGAVCMAVCPMGKKVGPGGMVSDVTT